MAEHVHLGYAATEHGNQSDTRHASITLVTPTTTGRGVYVAMTRGRETNLAYVITNEPTPEAARGVLEGVLASDRADIPSTVQRRQLATQTAAIRSMPALRPRCGIPQWFAPVRAAAVNDFGKVNEAIHAIDTRHATETHAIAHAKTAVHNAKTALLPFDRPFRDALNAVAEAKTTVTAAEAALGERRWVGRRPAQQHLTATQDRLADAETVLESVSTDRHPYLQALDKAERHLATIVDSARMRDLLDRYEFLPEQHAVARNVITALDIWHDWATGTDTPTEHVTWAVDTFESLDQHPDQQSFKAMVEAVRTRTPELITTRTIEIERRPEFDLGNGL